MARVLIARDWKYPLFDLDIYNIFIQGIGGTMKEAVIKL